MKKPEPVPSEPMPRPASGDEKVGLGAFLELHPFPAIAVEAGSAWIRFANGAARRMGLAPSPAGGSSTSVYATDAGQGRIEAKEVMRYLLTQATGSDGVEIAWHMPPRAIHFRVFCRPMPTQAGEPALALLTFLDITRQKQSEVELREAMEARDEFFSIATHELKDPLFALQLSIQLLRHAAQKQGEIPGHVSQHLEVSHRQADRLAQLIDNLLDVSRIANHRLRLDVEALDLCELARDVVARLQPKARAAETTIEADVSEPVIGYFDRMKIEQVLGNLLTNAIKYGGGRPVRVRIRGDDETAILEVQDEGPGIAPADQERIFRRFERASDKHRSQSLGLGLYIVRSLVEAHGGTIALRSAPGQGTTFTITLPRKRLAATPPDDPADSTTTE